MERPFLGVSFGRLLGEPDQVVKTGDAGAAQTAVWVTNHGRTPARNVVFKGKMAILKRSEVTGEASHPRHPPFALLLEAYEGNPESLAPRMCHAASGGGLPLYYGLQSDGRATPKDGEALYAFGEVTYETMDMPPVSIARITYRTTFCAEWRGKGGWVTAPQHNDGT